MNKKFFYGFALILGMQGSAPVMASDNTPKEALKKLVTTKADPFTLVGQFVRVGVVVGNLVGLTLLAKEQRKQELIRDLIASINKDLDALIQEGTCKIPEGMPKGIPQELVSPTGTDSGENEFTDEERKQLVADIAAQVHPKN